MQTKLDYGDEPTANDSTFGGTLKESARLSWVWFNSLEQYLIIREWKCRRSKIRQNAFSAEEHRSKNRAREKIVGITLAISSPKTLHVLNGCSFERSCLELVEVLQWNESVYCRWSWCSPMVVWLLEGTAVVEDGSCGRVPSCLSFCLPSYSSSSDVAADHIRSSYSVFKDFEVSTPKGPHSVSAPLCDPLRLSAMLPAPP